MSTVTAPGGTSIAVATTGSGPGLILVGGALQAAKDYAGLAALLADRFTVHAVDRRGRGGSGPHGDDYSMATEVADLLAVQAATGARLLVGHSYGGLIALETAARSAAFDAVSVYEPGVSLHGSIGTAWLPEYRARLAADDPYGAFARFIRSSPEAPAAVRFMPFWYLRLALHAMPGFRADVAPRLAGSALEHEQVAACADGLERYAAIRARVQVLRGGASPASVRDVAVAVEAAIPGATGAVLPKVGHLAPLGKRPGGVAEAVTGFLVG